MFNCLFEVPKNFLVKTELCSEQWSRCGSRNCLSGANLGTDVRRGLFLSQKKLYRSVTTNNLLPGMFLRRDTRKQRKLRNFDGYRFCATRRKKGTALHDGVGSCAGKQLSRRRWHHVVKMRVGVLHGRLRNHANALGQIASAVSLRPASHPLVPRCSSSLCDGWETARQ